MNIAVAGEHNLVALLPENFRRRQADRQRQVLFTNHKWIGADGVRKHPAVSRIKTRRGWEMWIISESYLRRPTNLPLRRQRGTWIVLALAPVVVAFDVGARDGRCLFLPLQRHGNYRSRIQFLCKNQATLEGRVFSRRLCRAKPGRLSRLFRQLVDSDRLQYRDMGQGRPQVYEMINHVIEICCWLFHHLPRKCYIDASVATTICWRWHRQYKNKILSLKTFFVTDNRPQFIAKDFNSYVA